MRKSNWAGRPKSALVKFLMDERGYTYQDMADLLNICHDTFRSKMYHGSFSFEDIMQIAKFCGYNLELIDNDTGTVSIDIREFFKKENADDYN